jgi:hypothetical protein
MIFLIRFSQSPISNIVIWQRSIIFGQQLFDSQGLEDSEWGSFRHFFQVWPFSLKMVPSYQCLTKSSNFNCHYLALYMLYMNQITKIKKYWFLVHYDLILSLAVPRVKPNFGFFCQNKKSIWENRFRQAKIFLKIDSICESMSVYSSWLWSISLICFHNLTDMKWNETSWSRYRVKNENYTVWVSYSESSPVFEA